MLNNARALHAESSPALEAAALVLGFRSSQGELGFREDSKSGFVTLAFVCSANDHGARHVDNGRLFPDRVCLSSSSACLRRSCLDHDVSKPWWTCTHFVWSLVIPTARELASCICKRTSADVQ